MSTSGRPVFFFQAEDGIRVLTVTGVQTCALPISRTCPSLSALFIFTDITAIIAKHQPEIMAIEDVFYALNVKSALKLGQVRGVAMLAASTSGLQVAEYSPLSIKSAVVGYGRADKFQVQQMVTRLLNLTAPPEPTDASDALAIAICHIHTAATNNRYAAVSR